MRGLAFFGLGAISASAFLLAPAPFRQSTLRLQAEDAAKPPAQEKTSEATGEKASAPPTEAKSEAGSPKKKDGPKATTEMKSEGAPPKKEEGGEPKKEAPKKPPLQFSKSIPFLIKPKNLDGYVGNAEFDPLGLAEYIDIRWMREAELKNGRVAMLAVLGWVVQQFVHLPGERYAESNPLKAFYQVGPQPLAQIFLFCGFLEFALHKGKMTIPDMFADTQREPGNFGFDPLGFGKDPAKRERYALSEIKNGRLAMIAIGGLIHQTLLTGQATPFEGGNSLV